MSADTREPAIHAGDTTASTLERRLLDALRPRPEIAEAYLFGSHATGRARAHSDVDVAVFVEPAALRALETSSTYGYAAELTAHLMAALGRNHLAQLGVISAELSKRLRPMAGFRNVLVHRYLDVDLSIVEQVLGEGLSDLEAFADAVEQRIART